MFDKNDWEDMKHFFLHETYGRLVLAQTILGTIAMIATTYLLWPMI